ncbi:DUF4359 domain-containing protein [Fibrella sp. ES10-3-2-2]|nr:hypothetical protein A6C57_01115 [Fibrella sp. ES10-3-2-2]
MSRSQFSVLLGVIALAVLFITNPKEDEHKSVMKTKLNALLMQSMKKEKADQMAQGFAALLGPVFMDRLVEASVHRNNYFLFSTTDITLDKQTKTVGLGILGSVFLSSKIDETINKNLMMAK